MRQLPRKDDSFVSVVVVGLRRPPVWQWPAWRDGAAALEPLVDLVEVPTAIRSQQLVGGTRKAVPLGRMAWGPPEAQRWVQGSPGAAAESLAWEHLATEVWAPRWTECDRQAMAPILFVEIANPHMLGEAQAGQYNQLLHVGLPQDLVRAHQPVVEAALRALASAVDAGQVVFRETPWWRHGDCLQDGLRNHFSYVGPRHHPVPQLSAMRTRWTVFDGMLP